MTETLLSSPSLICASTFSAVERGSCPNPVMRTPAESLSQASPPVIDHSRGPGDAWVLAKCNCHHQGPLGVDRLGLVENRLALVRACNVERAKERRCSHASRGQGYRWLSKGKSGLCAAASRASVTPLARGVDTHALAEHSLSCEPEILGVKPFYQCAGSVPNLSDGRELDAAQPEVLESLRRIKVTDCMDVFDLRLRQSALVAKSILNGYLQQARDFVTKPPTAKFR